MPVSTVRKRLESLFLHFEDVPESADYARLVEAQLEAEGPGRVAGAQCG